jgi:hypothetical protein
MMVLPFASLSLALWLTFRSSRSAALWAWAGSLVITLVLFRMHATEALNLGW